MSAADELQGMTEIHLFAGAGGGVLGSMRFGLKTVAYVEWDDYPQKILAARMADGLLETAPVFGDVREFDTTPYEGKVDIVSGGFPCQPFSMAGKRLAESDPRNMWPATRDIIRRIRPKYAFLENVPGLLTDTHGYSGVVFGELARSGYDIVWTCLPAAAIGAAHRRDRMWILGRRRGSDTSINPEGTLVEFARFDQGDLSWRNPSGQCRGDTQSPSTSFLMFPRSGVVSMTPNGAVVMYAIDPVSMADGTTRDGWPWPRILEDLHIPDPQPTLSKVRPYGFDPSVFRSWKTPSARDMKNASMSFIEAGIMSGNHSGLDGEVVAVTVEEYAARMGLDALELVRNRFHESMGYLNPDWVEWLMGWPIGWTSLHPMAQAEIDAYRDTMPGTWWHREPAHVPRIVMGHPKRQPRLKACGNGQVSLCASAAFEVLLETYRQLDVVSSYDFPNEIDALAMLGL